MFKLFKSLHNTSPSGGDSLVDAEAFAVSLFRANHFAVMPAEGQREAGNAPGRTVTGAEEPGSSKSPKDAV